MEDENYSTSDLALVTLLSLTFTIEKVDKTNSKKVIFIFKKNKPLEKVIDQYLKKKLKVEPQDFFNQIRIIKSMIYGK